MMYKISELAERSGTTVDALRHYEKIGILPEPRRLPNGYREYSGEHLTALNFVKLAKAGGFTLSEIRRLMNLFYSQADVQAFTKLLRAKIQELEEREREISRLKTTLKTVLAECGTENCSLDISLLGG